MAANRRHQRSRGEKLFLVLFFPGVFAFYVLYKYPHWILGNNADLTQLHLGGKSPGFWYASIYTLLVCGTCVWVLWSGRNRYQTSRRKGPLSRYQRGKFVSIFLAQGIAFYVVPFILPALSQEGGFFSDPGQLASKAAHVYVYPGFQSWGMACYLFVVIPVAVWFFGKRYCSWFCACGNLAEAVGVLPWGQHWVRWYTPRSETSKKLEVVQVYVLCFAAFFGIMLLLDTAALFSRPGWIARMQAVQDLTIDFLFGSVVGVGAYPVLGTRIWCRYGCPLAQGMKLFGRFSRSRFAVVPNSACRGLGLCTQACPMGIDVAGYAHRDKKPIEVSFGLDQTPCIGCGGCIDVCPVDALSFQPVGKFGLSIMNRDDIARQIPGESEPPDEPGASS